MLPFQCPRCQEIFKSDTAQRIHLQQDPPCSVKRDNFVVEGITKDQEKRLRSRKKTRPGMTDEDKWKEIYTILFPDDDHTMIPSAYFEEEKRALTRSDSGGSGDIEDFATFVRRDMPTFVRRELETLLSEQVTDFAEQQKMLPIVTNIINSFQPRLIQLYNKSLQPEAASMATFGNENDTPSGSRDSGFTTSPSVVSSSGPPTFAATQQLFFTPTSAEVTSWPATTSGAMMPDVMTTQVLPTTSAPAGAGPEWWSARFDEMFSEGPFSTLDFGTGMFGGQEEQFAHQ
jgi:hypothetical protein